MPRRTKEQAQATRDQLLDAAESLFLARGLVHTSLSDIAQAAGLTRGAIYWHFADKVALAQALLDRVDLPMEQALSDAELAVQADPVERLHTLALAPFVLMQRDPRARRVFAIMLQRTEFIGELAPLTARHDAALGKWIMRMERLFLAAQRRKRLAPGVQPRHAATALLALVDGLLRLATLPVAGPVAEPAPGSATPTATPAAAADARTSAQGGQVPSSAWSSSAAMRAAGPAIGALLAGLSQAAATQKPAGPQLSANLPQPVFQANQTRQLTHPASGAQRPARAPSR